MRTISQRDFGQLLLSYLVNVFLFGITIVFFRANVYYSNFISQQAQTTLLTLYGFYVIAAIPLELLLPPERRRLEGKGLIALRSLLRAVRRGWQDLQRFPSPYSDTPYFSKREKTAILFLLVKLFFLPVMVNFTLGNWSNVVYHWMQISSTGDINDLFLNTLFPCIIAGLFFVDTFIFTFGYAVEYPAVNNEVRSVEPTLFGWVITLICYPPFNNDVLGRYLIWPADSGIRLEPIFLTYVVAIGSLITLFLYFIPTLALGTRSSNLTNRGIVTWGPYAYIRHPAYVFKLATWWISSIPFLIQPGNFLVGVLSLSVWSIVYFFRAITEENNLIQDPDYQEYCKQVPWRFIPSVF